MKFHIDVNGNPAPCRAVERACPRDQHFESQRDAHLYVARREAQKDLAAFMKRVSVREQNEQQGQWVREQLTR